MREGFTNEVIAKVKQSIGDGDRHVEWALADLERRRLAEQQPTSLRHDPVVYYMRMDRLVKIGTTKAIYQRVAQIMPQGVVAVELGDRELERLRHTQFIAQHSHGEWFWLNDEIWTHIVKLRDDAMATFGMSTEDWLKAHDVRERPNFAYDPEAAE